MLAPEPAAWPFLIAAGAVLLGFVVAPLARRPVRALPRMAVAVGLLAVAALVNLLQRGGR